MFIGTSIWSIGEYELLLGVGLGWLPSLIVVFIAVLLWPLIAIAVAWFVYIVVM